MVPLLHVLGAAGCCCTQGQSNCQRYQIQHRGKLAATSWPLQCYQKQSLLGDSRNEVIIPAQGTTTCVDDIPTVDSETVVLIH